MAILLELMINNNVTITYSARAAYVIFYCKQSEKSNFVVDS